MQPQHPDTTQPIVLIPAYKPDDRLPQLIEALRAEGFPALVVDDGSGERFQPIFARCAELGALVLHHAVNLGKGRALKTGLNEILLRWPQTVGILTADADGQHTPGDIRKVSDALRAHPQTLILGARAFSGEVPWKSRVGNGLTRAIYRIATGIRVGDTQTGLRGIPRQAAAWMMSLPGERYEFEMNMLLKLRDMVLPVLEVPIETVYIDGNAGSHFHPLRDGARIYLVILRYVGAALTSFCLDYGLYLVLLGLLSRLLSGPAAAWAVLVSYAIARVCSSLLNYTLNKHTVFGGHGGKSALVRYYLLAAAQLALGAWLTMRLSAATSLSEQIAKLPVDALLFCGSYFIQRDFVFRANTNL